MTKHSFTKLILLVLIYSLISIYLITRLRLLNQWPSITKEDLTIDWHDYKFIVQEELRLGIGENGSEAKLPKLLEKLKESLYKQNGFNAALSDLISVNRSIPDIRHIRYII